MRKAHPLSITKGTSRPSNVLFYDTETTQEYINANEYEQKLKSIYAQYTRSNNNQYLKVVDDFDIPNKETFWDYVISKTRSKSTLYLVAHNFIFDIVVMDGVETLAKKGWNLVSYYSNGMTSIFRWGKDDKKIIGLDNTNFFAGTLSSWGKRIGLDKLTIDFETATDEELRIYNIRDVEIMVKLWRVWLQFLDKHNSGNFKMTVASTAMNTFRNGYYNGSIYIHNKKEVLQLERNAYKGGRTECLYQGKVNKSKYYYLDINNMYGYVLMKQKYPVSLQGYKKSNSLSILQRKLDKYAVIADVNINTTDNAFVHKIDGKTCYPLGRFRTTITTPELKLLISNNQITRVHSFAWYREEQVFGDFVNYFYKLRREYTDKNMMGFATIAKLMINSLYGKFGQRGIKQEVLKDAVDIPPTREYVYHADTSKNYTLTALGGTVFKEWKEGESYHSAPAIAGHVTAYARLLLYSMLKKVPKKHAFYMDTDSLIVDEIGYKTLKGMIKPESIGCLKIELSSDWLEINAPKDYAMEGRTKIKGVSKKAVKRGVNTYEQESWSRLAGMIQRRNVSNYIVRKTVKTQKRIIYSGEVQSSGWVEPFVLSET